MQTQIVIRDFERTENLEDYLRTKIEESLTPFLQNYENSTIFVKVQEDRHRSLTRKPHFQCEVRLKLPRKKMFITVRKEGDHFYDCVQKVSDTLREVMGRKHHQMASLQARRKKTITEIPYDYEHDVNHDVA